jgi:hypothetical protein
MFAVVALQMGYKLVFLIAGCIWAQETSSSDTMHRHLMLEPFVDVSKTW